MTPSHPGLTARRATIDDAARITDIYNQGIGDRVATFETEPRAVDTVRRWFDTAYPIVVVESGGEVVAWAGASSYRPRACYAQIAEFSVYVDRGNRGHGAGTRAMQALIDAAAEAGLEKLVSRVFVENLGSRAMLRKVGFREVGIYERHGMLDGVWRDVVIVERLLQDHTGEPTGALWQPDPDTLSLWSELQPGMPVIIEKEPWEHGRERAGYEAMLVRPELPDPWIEVRAIWTLRDIELGGLPFRIGDEMREFFSPRHPFNAFAVYAPDGTIRGWYGNVTRTPRLRREGQDMVLTWPDLVLDVVALPDGTVTLLDEEEMANSGFETTAPWLIEQVFAARDELLRLLQSGFFPTG